jgi:hypothetical protein
MTRITRWTRRAAIGLGVVAGVLAVAWVALRLGLPSDEELARRIEAEFETRLGEKLSVGSVSWRIFPAARVVARDVRTLQTEPITARLIEIDPELWPLLQRRVVIDNIRVEGAMVPRNAMVAFRGKGREQDGHGSPFDAFSLARLVFKDVTYLSYSGIPVAYDGMVDFDADWRPRTLQLSRPGVTPPAVLDAARDGSADRWALAIRVAGGTANGHARLDVAPAGRMVVSGELAPRGVEMQVLLGTFNRRSPIGGRASGTTTLRAEGDTVGELARALHSHSVLTAQDAKVLRFDLDKTVKSLGKDHAGETPLDTLSGTVDTQNTDHGMRTRFINVQATSGRYSATGHATVYRQQLQAEGRLSIAGGLVDVPFTASGPVRKPALTISKGLFAGAAIGTAILPGLGTVIGARIGAAIGGPPAPARAASTPVSPRRP